MSQRLFMDYQSSTPLLPEVSAAMEPYGSTDFGSPSSLHRHGHRARAAISQARDQVRRLIRAESPDNILFTSGATESANLAVKGTLWANRRFGDHVVLAATEHPAVFRSVEWLHEWGFKSTLVPVDSVGRIDPEAVRQALTDKTTLICVHHAHPDVGTLQPVAEIGRIARERGVIFFVDASASGGWIPVDVQAMGIDLLSLSPHRFHGPKGVGVLCRNRRARLTSLIHGGDQENGVRAGTENVPAIVGAGVAAAIAEQQLPRRVEHLRGLQRHLWASIQRQIQFVRLDGPEPGPERLPANLHCCIEFIEGEGLVLLMDSRGLAIQSGPSCLVGTLRIPPILKALQLPQPLLKSSVQLSLGMSHTLSDVDRATQLLAQGVHKLREMSPLWTDFQAGRVDSVIAPRAKDA